MFATVASVCGCVQCGAACPRMGVDVGVVASPADATAGRALYLCRPRRSWPQGPLSLLFCPLSRVSPVTKTEID